MARVHYWQYLIDETGVPIEDANIYVYLAGGTSSADILAAESGGTSFNSVPPSHDDYVAANLITTNSEGFFEFWVEDPTGTTAPYEISQKFKISWYRAGSAEGNIDYITILSGQQFPSDVTAAGAGTDGTISSRSAIALGECDGFLKMYKEDGTLVYVPYWENITP